MKVRLRTQMNRFSSASMKMKLVVGLSLATLVVFLSATVTFFYVRHQRSENLTSENVSQEEGNLENEGSDDQITSENGTETDKAGSDGGSSAQGSDSTSSTDGSTPPSSDGDQGSTPEPEPEPPPAPESPSAVVAFYADNQSDSDADDVIHQRTVNNILSSGANPVFHAGDLMEDGTLDSWNRFSSVTATLRSSRAFYAALGNNDRVVGDSSTPSPYFLDNFSFPNNERWYSVNYGNLHLVVLDSAFASGSATQLSWLASDLQSSASQSRITGVMFHHPTFASTISSYLVNYGVDFVVMGHNHSYNHWTSNGINYFVMSGQTSLGHMIARIYSDHVTFTDYNNSNGVVESGSFNER